jgi:hypothetical protein
MASMARRLNISTEALSKSVAPEIEIRKKEAFGLIKDERFPHNPSNKKEILIYSLCL